MPISGLVITFESSASEHQSAIDALEQIPEVELGDACASKLPIVVDTKTKRRDQEIWNAVQQLPGVVDVAVALVGFEEDDRTDADENTTAESGSTERSPSDSR